MNDTEALLKEYFVLKDQMRRLNDARNDFMENYQCQRIEQDDFEEPPKNCHQRRDFPQDDMCEPCSRRHWYYLERQKNARRRGQITQLLRGRYATPPNPLTNQEASK